MLLVSVDGAVLLSRDLNLIGFGARFTAKLESESTIKNVGMRHKSAHDFCCQVNLNQDSNRILENPSNLNKMPELSQTTPKTWPFSWPWQSLRPNVR
jgi:hypothetical protein